MRLVSFVSSEGVKLGVKTERGIVDVQQLADKGAPETLEALIKAGTAGTEKLQHLVEQAEEFIDEEDLTFAPAVQHPKKIICSGANYRKHVAEANLDIPEYPIYFPKYENSLAAHNEDVAPPTVTEQVDYEVELVVVIGKKAHNVNQDEALDYVFGYATGNDLSARDLQFRGIQWMYGKAIDKFAPVGPYLVTADEVPDPQNLNLECRVNGEVRQRSNTANMIFPVAEMISDLSKIMTLEPGDVLFTGTPEGVIAGMSEKNWLKTGDEIVCEVEGLGKLVNKISG